MVGDSRSGSKDGETDDYYGNHLDDEESRYGSHYGTETTVCRCDIATLCERL